MTLELPDDETRGVEPPSDLRIYTAFVAVEYDFKVIARSEAEAIESARHTWSQALATVAVAHVEVSLSNESLDSPDLSE